MRFSPSLAMAAGLMVAAPAAAEDVTQTALPVPSGMTVYWQDVVHTAPGTYGLTYRFRFVAPHLADLLPAPAQQPGSRLSDEDMAILDDPVTWQVGLADAPDEVTVTLSPQASPLPLARNGDAGAGDALPADDTPDPALMALQDDMIWLCRHYALPRIAAPAPRPVEIVISIADRPTLFGAVNPEMVQVFEAYDLPAGQDACLWEAA
ncbi:DUF6497 family protein [Paracoccus sp. p1-h21]|uniref:DUF6497 family protein n=2 Tax=unclassified Paracoccus (in: a-proteobacteria) TaxID=2688777 RepID=UPI0037B24593